jgi:hypothetical protein
MDKASYLKLHGSDSFEKVFSNILSLNELNSSGERVYLQIMKINETDEFALEMSRDHILINFYDFWEGYKVPLFSRNRIPTQENQGQKILRPLPAEESSMLAPSARPVYSVRRNCAYCKQEIDGEKGYGNITTTPLKKF